MPVNRVFKYMLLNIENPSSGVKFFSIILNGQAHKTGISILLTFLYIQEIFHGIILVLMR